MADDQSPPPDGDERARQDAADRACAAIVSLIDQEDAPRGGTKERTTREQVEPALGDATAAAQRTIDEYEAAVDRLRGAYLGSLLYSTDAPELAGDWSADEQRDELGSDTFAAHLAAWLGGAQSAILKFALVGSSFRVGVTALAHVDVAGGPAIAAGLIRIDGNGALHGIENTSGGFRPGYLRNLTARAAVPASALASDLRVIDNPDGDYDQSVLLRPR
ncbi:MAG TPA: hypothetical protein VFF06_11575 [Polyangia bacterium]|nr:hypothetical protein [Polyangia bacterium]